MLMNSNKNMKAPKPEKVKKPKLSKNKITDIIFAVVLVLTHIAILAAVILSFRYYSIYPSIFGSIVAIVLCLLIIIDIVFFVGFNHKDLAYKIISIVLASFLLIGGTVGTYFISRANGIVNGILGNGSDTQYETFSGVFVSNSETSTISSLKDIEGKRVGLLNETTNGITYLAIKAMDHEGVKYTCSYFNTNIELLQALVMGEVDVIALTSAYRSIFENDENSSFTKDIEKFNDFYSFSEDIKVTTNKTKKNISKEPFNVLLIGYSRTDIGSSVGLADSIILATINPLTYTVSMMSIARDSFVPIACYGGQYDKINSGRSTSRACFIETVEDFIGMDVDFYMELDYLGLVAIVDAIGGIHVNNEVTFTLDGVTVPAGENVFCDGIMALQFCRERHAFIDGDFARQRHQKEVIMAVARKFISSGDITIALNAMDSASDWMSTDLTLSQLTDIFNLLLNTKNYTGLDTFDLVDFQNFRITGDGGIRYYSYSMNLPLWIYQIYKGSYDESMQYVNNVMGNYDSINQDYTFGFSAHEPYNRPAFYSLDYDQVYMFNPDPMPAYWYNLDGYTLQEAMAWANSNGVSLTVEYIGMGDSRYDATYEGKVYSQSVRYGQLVSSNKSGTIYVMGSADESQYVPDFVGENYSKVIRWAEKYGVSYKIDYNPDVPGNVGEVLEQSVKPYTSRSECDYIKVVVKAGKQTVTFDKNGYDTTVPSEITIITGDKDVTFSNPGTTQFEKEGRKYSFDGWYTAPTGGTKVSSTADISGNATVYAHYSELGKYTYKYVDGTTELASGSEYVGTNPTAPANPTKENYVFDGWTKTGEAVKDGNVTFTATWKEETENQSPSVVPEGCVLTTTVDTDVEADDGQLISVNAVVGKATGKVYSCTYSRYRYVAPEPETEPENSEASE